MTTGGENLIGQQDATGSVDKLDHQPEYDRDSVRSRDRDRDRESVRDKGRGRDRTDRDRDMDRHHRGLDRNRDRDGNERRERGRDRDEDDTRRRGRDYNRRRDNDWDRDDMRHRLRSKSPSKGRSRCRSKSRSRSRSKSKRVSGFDMAPPATAMAAAVAAVNSATTGQIPGSAAAIPGMFPNLLQAPNGQAQQLGSLPIMPIQAMTQQATRHARRVYVGGLPPSANEQTVATYFSKVMAEIGGNTAGPGDAVVNVYINHEKKFAFVEMRSVEEASNAMALDGIIFEGAPVKVRRPSDYNPSLAAALGPSHPNPNLNLAAVQLSAGSSGVLEGPDRLFVGGLPYNATEPKIREILETFGPLRGFDLVRDRETGNSKGYAFCLYKNVAVTDEACAALNGIPMGNNKFLTVRRANQNGTQPRAEQESVLLHAQQQIAIQRFMLQHPTTKVVCLTQAVTVDELKDDAEYEEIVKDMRIEGSKFGTLVNVVIPRPQLDGSVSSGVGKVLLEYADTDGARNARAGMNGRKYGVNEVVAMFYPENKYYAAEYDG